MLRATTTCNFSSLKWPAGSAPAALASLLFDPLQPRIIGKTQCFATFLPFRAPASFFFSLFLFSTLLYSSLCCSSLLFFDSYHLCFSSVHVVGSLTSKLPSNTHILTCSKVQNICIYTFATHVTGKYSLVKLAELHTREAGKGFSAATAQGKQHKVDAGVLSFGPHTHSVPVDLDA